MAYAEENIDELPFCDSDYEEVGNPALPVDIEEDAAVVSVKPVDLIDNKIADESGNGYTVHKASAFYDQFDEPWIER